VENSSIERNEAFDLAFSFITETAENIFLTGKAGTGKTTFLKYLKDNTTKNLVVAAPTGVAAINAGGVTLHSLFQLPFHPFLPTQNNREELLKKLKFNNQRLSLLRKMEVLVIDEISMVRADVMDAIDTILKSVRRNYEAAFGGVQLLCIGDLYQLPPVAQNHEWNILQEYYASPFFFDSYAIKEQQPFLIELDKIYRQKEATFVTLLNKVRNNNLQEDDFEILNERFLPGFTPLSNEKYITLTSHNKQADVINNSEIEKLITPPFVYKANIENDFPESMYPAEISLLLKVGTQVMFLKNDLLEKKYYNGKIGVIKNLENNKVVVECDGKEIEVFRDTWENKKYSLNRTDGKLLQETVGEFTQFPLRLAWAITIHKSQGLTFDKVMIDAASAFSSGQVYVALSRCTSLQGIVLLSKIPASAVQTSTQVADGQKALIHKGSLAERFIGARQLYTLQILDDLFSMQAVANVLDQLKRSIFSEKLKLNNGSIDWIENLCQAFLIDKVNGGKFIRHINAMLKDEPTIEKNEVLQQRLADAAKHFAPKLNSYLDIVKQQPLITEHKETADTINVILNEVATVLHTTHYFMSYCTEKFTLLNYLKHRINLSTPRFNISCYGNSKVYVNKDIPQAALYGTLKTWRDSICDVELTPIYMVATHEMLKAICTYLPRNKRDLLLISGFGKAKVDKFGDEILEIVLEYCEANNIADKKIVIEPKAKKTKAASTSKPAKETTVQSSYNLLKAGKTIAEIAAERNLAISTIEGHVAAFVENGLEPIDKFIGAEKVKELVSFLQTNEPFNTTEFILQNPSFSYFDIKLVRAYLKVEEKK
jgi:hypothetical protein